jgi:hypothetical protein
LFAQLAQNPVDEPAGKQQCCNARGNRHECDHRPSLLAQDVSRGKLKVTHAYRLRVRGRFDTCGRVARGIIEEMMSEMTEIQQRIERVASPRVRP